MIDRAKDQLDRIRTFHAILGPAVIILIALLFEYGYFERSWSLLPLTSSEALAAPVRPLGEGPQGTGGQATLARSNAASPDAPRGDLLPRGTGATAARLEQFKSRPPLLRAFLQRMPKGGDLHLHLSGAVYAEKLIAWAIEDELCIDPAAAVLQECSLVSFFTAVRPLADVVHTDIGFGQVVDAWSMRNHTPEAGSGHDRFFGTFGKFREITRRRTADLLAEVVRDAAAQNVGYLEIMLTVNPPTPPSVNLTIATVDDLQTVLEATETRLAIAALAEQATQALDSLDRQIADAKQLAGCPDEAPYRICDVEVRFLQHVNRNRAAGDVFKAMVWAFALVAADGPVVGFNMVGAEDRRLARTDYQLHMQMLQSLAALPGFEGVPVALHAGELTQDLVPPADLRSHLADAVRIGGARRLGHAVSLGHEEDVFGLLRQLSEEQIPIEINLSSNDLVLGVAGAAHPFQVYRDYDVPLVISTDDPGVARSDLTREYERATQTGDLGYADLKQLARNSLTFAFIDGESLWLDPRTAVPVDACRGARSQADPSEACRAFLHASPKARLQWDLESRFAAFEVEAW